MSPLFGSPLAAFFKISIACVYSPFSKALLAFSTGVSSERTAPGSDSRQASAAQIRLVARTVPARDIRRIQVHHLHRHPIAKISITREGHGVLHGEAADDLIVGSVRDAHLNGVFFQHGLPHAVLDDKNKTLPAKRLHGTARH